MRILLNNDKLLFIVNLLLGIFLFSIGYKIALLIGTVNLTVAFFIILREYKVWIKKLGKN